MKKLLMIGIIMLSLTSCWQETNKHKETLSTENEIWKIVETTERGSYEKYAFVFRHFTNKVSLNKLVKRAGDDNFINWLKSLE